VILGSAGAGKSTLAASIARRTGLPVIHLDVLFWRAGWVLAPQDEAHRGLATAMRDDRWIIEGNFLGQDGGGPDPRFARAEVVIFLDVGRVRCLWRVLRRLAHDRGRSRPDLPEGCAESLDLTLLRWIWGYPAAERPRVLRLLTQLPSGMEVHRLRSDRDVARFVSGLS
jgi:adenylate kinase family enzyme